MKNCGVFALLINEYQSNKPIPTESDETQIENWCSKLGLNTPHFLHNGSTVVGSGSIQNRLEMMKNTITTSGYDSVILFTSSHGSDNNTLLSDNASIEWKYFIYCLKDIQTLKYIVMVCDQCTTYGKGGNKLVFNPQYKRNSVGIPYQIISAKHYSKVPIREKSVLITAFVDTFKDKFIRTNTIETLMKIAVAKDPDHNISNVEAIGNKTENFVINFK